MVKETPRFLGPNGRYVSDTRYALGATSGHPTPPEYWVAGEEVRDVPEPQCVSKEDLQKMTEDSRARYNAAHPDELFEHQGRILALKLTKLQREGAKCGVDLGPRLHALLQEWRQEVIEHKKAA